MATRLYSHERRTPLFGQQSVSNRIEVGMEDSFG